MTDDDETVAGDIVRVDGGNVDDGETAMRHDALIAALAARRAASVEQEERLLGALRNAAALLATHASTTGDDPRG